MRGIDHLTVLWIRFCLLDDPVHHAHRLDRILARGGFGRQHDRIGAVVDGGGDVGGFRACRHGARNHRLKHLRGHDDGLADSPAAADDPLLDRRYALRRQLDSEVAARHHDRIGYRHDLLEPLNRRRLLELGHDPGAIPDDGARLRNVFGALHERERDPVDAKPQGQEQVGVVLRRQGCERQHHARHIDALVLRERAADHDRGLGKIGAASLDRKAQSPIIEQ